MCHHLCGCSISVNGKWSQWKQCIPHCVLHWSEKADFSCLWSRADAAYMFQEVCERVPGACRLPASHIRLQNCSLGPLSAQFRPYILALNNLYPRSKRPLHSYLGWPFSSFKTSLVCSTNLENKECSYWVAWEHARHLATKRRRIESH